MQCKVSIIIACYNDPFVVKAVRSAFEQSYSNKEIIVIDDGSNEETKSGINEVKDMIDILIEQANGGQSVARNNAIKKASGEYILNLDSDDYFEPEFCEKAIKLFQADEEIKIVTCKAQRFSKRGEIDVFTPRGGGLENFLFSNSALGSSMFKRSHWQDCGGYEEVLPILGFEDWEFYLNILKSGGYAKVLPEVLFHYQVRENSTTARIKDEKLNKFKFIILKHSGLYKENFELLVDHLINKVEKEMFQTVRRENSADFKLGRAILKPIRFFRYLFK